MAFHFDQSIDRRDGDSSKWRKYGPEVLPLWVADMDFAVAPAIVDALKARIEHPVFGYGLARDKLRHAIVADMAARYDWTITPGDIVFLPGVEPGFNMALKAFLQPGDGVLVQPPVYAPILAAPGHWQLQRVEAPLQPDAHGGWQIDFDQFEQGLDQSRAFLLCHPHNPVGKVFTRDELTAIAERCVERDVVIISDEIHGDLLFDGRRHVPIASLSSEVAQRTITLMAASKTYNIAGLKTAFAIIPNAALRERFVASKLGMVDSVNVLGLEATLAAYTSAADWRQELLVYLQGNRDWLLEQVAIQLPGVTVRAPQGTFLAWLDCSALQLAPDPQQFFLQHAQVGLNPGADFGAAYGQCVRLNFGCTRATLAAAIARMARAVAARHG
jgi:cystathionine beta-lyase